MIRISAYRQGSADGASGKVAVMFQKLAGVDGEIDAEELQDMLTSFFSKGFRLTWDT